MVEIYYTSGTSNYNLNEIALHQRLYRLSDVFKLFFFVWFVLVLMFQDQEFLSMYRFPYLSLSTEILITHIHLPFAHVGKDNSKNDRHPHKNKYVQERDLASQILAQAWHSVIHTSF